MKTDHTELELFRPRPVRPRLWTFRLRPLVVWMIYFCERNSKTVSLFAIRRHKKKFSLSFPPASEFPAASNFFKFFICLIQYENKVYGFVSVVVMNYKFKKHDLPSVWR